MKNIKIKKSIVILLLMIFLSTIITGCKNKKDNLEIDSQQTKIVLSQTEKTIVESSLYSMLPMGTCGFYKTIGKEGITTHDIIIDRLYTGKEAEKIIKEYCKREDAFYDEYPQPPDGSTWHALSYSVSANPNHYYTDIRVCGLDGNNLTSQGISYPMRTHDILYDWYEEDGRYRGLVCFYAVPNGCKEYVLRCGDFNGDDETMNVGAYFIIKP